MRYYKNLGEELMVMDYDAEAELDKLIERLEKTGGNMPLDSYIETVHEETKGKHVLEDLLVLDDLLEKYPDIVEIIEFDFIGNLEYIILNPKNVKKRKKEKQKIFEEKLENFKKNHNFKKPVRKSIRKR